MRSPLHVAAAALLGLLLAPAAGCEPEAGPEAGSLGPRAPARVRVTDRAERLAVVVPGHLVIHRFEDAVQATSPDGAFRLYVRRTGEASLLHLAGPGKDTLLARGWTRTGEQHLERAIHVSFQRGGTARKPEERREVWWVARPGGTFVCDAVAARGGEVLLGEALREVCVQVTLPGADGGDAPDAGPAEPDAG